MKKIVMTFAACAVFAATAATPPQKAAMRHQQSMARQQMRAQQHQQKAVMHAQQQQQRAVMHAQQQQQRAVMHHQQDALRHQARAIQQQQHVQRDIMRHQARAIRAGGRAAMRGIRYANGHHVPPPSFHGWYRGPRPHAHFRNVWMDDVWYDAYGYPCYSPYYLEVVDVPGAVLYTPGAVVTPSPVVVAPQPAVVTPPPVVVTPPPAVVTPPPAVVVPQRTHTTVVVPEARTPAGRLVDALLAP